MLAGGEFGHAQLGVLSAMPMDDQHDLIGLLVNVSDDLFNETSNELLPYTHIDRGRVPREFEVACEVKECVTLHFRFGHQLPLRNSFLDFLMLLDGYVPPRLELCGH